MVHLQSHRSPKHLVVVMRGRSLNMNFRGGAKRCVSMLPHTLATGKAGFCRQCSFRSTKPCGATQAQMPIRMHTCAS
eukprot:355413-Chlamydomonas_euryale.AAC.3